MAGQEAVHAPTGPHQTHGGVEDAGGEGAGQDAAGVDETDPGTAVDHLQGDPQQELEGDVEGEVPPGVVYQAVTEGRVQKFLLNRLVGGVPLVH